LETALGEEGALDSGVEPLRSFGDYDLLEEVGRGGQGIVYRARQRSLKRIVAMKVIPFGHWNTESHVKRFRFEAEAAAGLDHPNLVPIYEVGAHDGWCYFTMKFIAGRRLDAVIARQPLAARRAATLLAKLARAVHYAHQRGVLHRDIKPGNILVDAQDEPHLTDFGLAKFTADESTVTKTTDVLGTPAYMSPEQAAGGACDATTAADVYALGAVFYEMLTGRAPFTGTSAIEVIRWVTEREPQRPSQLHPALNRDLETICLKCLEKKPEKRYASALVLAEETERWLRGEPIYARQIAPAERLWRWSRRNPVVALLSAVSLLLVIALAVGSTLAALRVSRAEKRALAELWASQLAQARAQRLSGVTGRRAQSLDAVRAAARTKPSLELRNEAIAALALTDVVSSRLVREAGARFDRVVVDAAFTRYAVLQETGGVKIHSLQDHRLLAELTLPPYRSANGSFSPDGHWFAACVSAGNVFLWNLARVDAPPRSDFPLVYDAARSITFTPDSRVFALASRDNAIHFYNLESGEELPLLPLSGAAYRINFDPKGEKLAVMIGGSVQLWDFSQRKRLRSISHAGAGTVMDWHPDGRHMAVGGDNGDLWWWDTLTGNERPLPGHTAYVSGVQFDPTGTLLVTSSWDDTTKFWDGTLGRLLFEDRGTGPCQFNADGAQMAFSREQGELELATVVRSEIFHQWTSPLAIPPHIGGVDVSADGQWFVFCDRQKWFLADARDGRELAALPMPNGAWPKFHPSGRSIFTLAPETVLQWPIERGTNSAPYVNAPTTLVSAKGSEWQRFAISADGELLAIAGHYRSVLVDLRGPVRQIEFARGLRESHVALSPDKRCVAVASYHGNGVTVWNTADGKLIRHVVTNDNAQIAFSADGRTLATATARECCWWNVETWQLRNIFSLKLAAGYGVPLAFSPDGRLFALAVDRQRIRLFEAGTGEEVATLTPPELLNVEPIVFSKDGSLLLAGTGTGLVVVWNLRALRRELAAMNLDW
jgi:WD40 repeat protein/predicted Ser/Thr protein kinase